MTTSTRLLEQFAKWARASGPEPTPNRPSAVHDANRACGLGFCWDAAENVGDVAAPREGVVERAGRRAPLLFQAYPGCLRARRCHLIPVMPLSRWAPWPARGSAAMRARPGGFMNTAIIG